MDELYLMMVLLKVNMRFSSDSVIRYTLFVFNIHFSS